MDNAGLKSPDELIGKNDLQMSWSDFAESYREDDTEVIESGNSKLYYIEPVMESDGSTHWVRSSKVPLRDGSGEIKGVMGMSEDITEQKQTENLQAALYQISEAVDRTDSLNELYQEMHVIIQSVMPADNFYIALYDEKKDLLSFPYFVDEVDIPPLPHEPGNGLTEYVLSTGNSLLYDKNVRGKLRRDGKAVMVGKISKIWLGVPLKIEKRTIGVMALQHYSDPKAYSMQELHMLEFVSAPIAKAIEKKRADEALRESKGKYRTIIENSLEGIYIAQNHILKFCNQQFADMFGYKDPENAIGKNVREIVNSKHWHVIDREVKTQESDQKHISHYQFTARRVDGTEFDVETLGSRIMYQGKQAVQGVMRDISEQRQLEEQLRHAQKMEAVGRLAGGVAHDFNNLLTAITGHSDMMLMSLDQNDPLQNDITEIQNAAKRAADLTRQLLAFSRKQTLKPKIIDLNDVIIEMDKMLRRIIGEDIELLTIPGNDLWSVKVDPGQFEQVIVNLVVNASDAMPKGGKLTIETKNLELDKGHTQVDPDITAGSYVMLAVSDTGVGMQEEVRARIFEPFFTTKEAGRGTGLGLSTIYGIVKQSDGHISVESEIGTGTSFKIFLPKASGKIEHVVQKQVTPEMPHGDETILVVEDEQTVRTLAVRTLKKLGYTVFHAKNGGDAFMMCKNRDKPVDLIVTDVVMPEMSGSEFVERVREFWSDVKVLYMSGYSFDGIIHEGTLDPEIPYLRKPFRLTELAQKIREVLDD